MRKIVLIILLIDVLITIVPLSGFCKKPTTTSSYNRAGVSIVIVGYDDQFDAVLLNAVHNAQSAGQYAINKRYWINSIETKSIRLKTNTKVLRNRADEYNANGEILKAAELSFENPNGNSAKSSLHKDIITETVNASNLAHQVLDFLLQHYPNGFDLGLLSYRSMWNANDAQVIEDNMQVVSKLDHNLDAVCEQNFIVVLDFRDVIVQKIDNYYNPFQKQNGENTNNKAKPSTTTFWHGKIEGYVYAIGNIRSILDSISTTMWYDKNDPVGVIREKCQQYENLPLALELVGCNSSIFSLQFNDTESMIESMGQNLAWIMRKLQKCVDAFNISSDSSKQKKQDKTKTKMTIK